MLVLTRKPSEEIVLGNNDIRIMLVQVKGKQARIGITAPKGMTIHRGEVFEAIKETNGTASGIGDGNSGSNGGGHGRPGSGAKAGSG